MRSSIRTRTRRSARIAAFALPLCLLTAPVRAQPAAQVPAAATSEDPASARELFRRGREAYDLQRFSEALALFEEAYRLDPRPHTLFSIAQCHRHLGHWERAAFTYRRFLDLGAPDPKTEQLARDLLAEMERRQATSDVPRQQKPFEPTPMPEPFVEAPLIDAPAPAAARAPLTRKWWFWAGTGTVVAVVAGGIVYAATRPEELRPTTLNTGDLR